jgi:GntR family transcriptional regulator/MocR family aminotransferase
MSVRRRAALRAWAHETDAWIIEDDYEGDFCFEGQAAAPMAAHADADRVLYIASLNNVMFPSLQVAALVVPDALVDRAQKALRSAQASTNTITQMVTHQFINEGFLARHIRASQELYADRRSHLRALLREKLDGVVTLSAQPMGLHVTAALNGLDDLDVEQRAAANGVTVNSIARFAAPLGMSAASGLVIGFASYPHAAITRAVGKLAQAVGAAKSA